jgi:hypothetical protein
MSSSKFSRAVSLLLAHAAIYRRIRLAKTRSPRLPDAVGVDPIENRALEQPDHLPPVSNFTKKPQTFLILYFCLYHFTYRSLYKIYNYN